MRINKDIKIFWQYLRKYKNKVFFVASIAIVAAAIAAVIPFIYGRLVDIAVDDATRTELIFGILGAWLLLTLISDWMGRFVDRKGVDIAVRSSNDLLLDLSNQLIRLPVGFHKDKKIGEILQRIGRANEYFRNMVEEIAFYIGQGLLKVLIALGILAYVEWRLSVTIFVILVLYLFITFFKTKKIIKTQRKLNKAYEKSFGDLYNSTFNVQVVKSSTGEEFENKRNIRNFKNITQKFRLVISAWIGMDAWQQSILGIGFVFIFGLGIFLLRINMISAGELIMFVGYTSLVYQPVAHLGHNFKRFKRGMTVINRALGLFKIEPEKYEDKGETVLKDVKGEVVFDRVSFYYKKQQPVLRNINFKAKSGEAIALVGESGVGKTTLTDLISRYVSPTKGRVLIDGHDIQEVNLISLRENIALVPQEISLFNATVKENIAYGKPGAAMKEILEVSKASNAHEFIQKFPRKYSQLVGERGIKLSTGQKQRVAIARALLRDPKILILDEATSSLDSVSEKLIQQALKRLIKGRTTFVIAHRLSTISHADKILVFEKGKVAESGTHEKLIRRKDGLYRKFYFMQSVFRDDLLRKKSQLKSKEE